MNILATMMFLCALAACSAINEKIGLKDDNVFEQAAEDFIKQETGIEIEFTPDNEEENA